MILVPLFAYLAVSAKICVYSGPERNCPPEYDEFVALNEFKLSSIQGFSKVFMGTSDNVDIDIPNNYENIDITVDSIVIYDSNGNDEIVIENVRH